MPDKTTLFDRIDRPRRQRNEVAASIIEAIDGGRLVAGDRLPMEAELFNRFGVARTVIRGSISLLSYDIVVESRRGVGAFVTIASQGFAFRISPACFEERKKSYSFYSCVWAFKRAHRLWPQAHAPLSRWGKSKTCTSGWLLPIIDALRKRSKNARIASFWFIAT